MVLVVMGIIKKLCHCGTGWHIPTSLCGFFKSSPHERTMNFFVECLTVETIQALGLRV